MSQKKIRRPHTQKRQESAATNQSKTRQHRSQRPPTQMTKDGWRVYQYDWGCADLTQADLACFADSKWVLGAGLYCGRSMKEDREIDAALYRYRYSIRIFWNNTMYCSVHYMIMPKVPTSVHDTNVRLWRSCALMAISRNNVTLPKETLRGIFVHCLRS